MFDVNKPETLEALKKWWGEFCERAPLTEEDVGEFCCAVVGNKVDLVGTDLGAPEGISTSQAWHLIHEIMPSTSRPPTPEALTASPTTAIPPLPPPSEPSSTPPSSTASIAIQPRVSYSPKRGLSQPRSRSSSRFYGTMSTTRSTTTIYHTPASSVSDVFHSARTSPEPSRGSSLISSFRATSPHSVRSRRNTAFSDASSGSDSGVTITPSLFAREQQNANASTFSLSTTPAADDELTPPAGSRQTLPLSPLRGPRLFYTSAKSGDGVKDVFEYVAERVARKWEYEEALEARRLHMREASAAETIRDILPLSVPVMSEPSTPLPIIPHDAPPNSSPNTPDLDDLSPGITPKPIYPYPEQLAQKKFVVAHFMVGNTAPYTHADWLSAFILAASKGFDAFALNVGQEQYQQDQVAKAFEAVLGAPPGFQLFMSLDMTSIPCMKASDRLLVAHYKQYLKHSRYFRYGGGPLVSTFSGQDCLFGEKNVDAGWTSALKTLLVPQVTFLPAFFIDPASYHNHTRLNGAFEWNSGWPLGNGDINFNGDSYSVSKLGGRPYMAAVSPWFFTHYGRDSWNKNFIYRTENWHLSSRWEQVIANRKVVDLVEVITWNDYGESHYIGPIAGDQPNSQAWVDGYDHQAWLDLIAYYIVAYKSGVYAVPTIDRIFMWGRLYPRGADCEDHVPRPVRWDWAEDTIYTVVLATAPAALTISCGKSTQTTDVGLGVSKVKFPFPSPLREACSMVATLSRAGVTTLEFEPRGFTLSPRSTRGYNFNAFVAASPAGHSTIPAERQDVL
ncbi:hypothetical protein ONZ45_g7810 [Pleurotus djamor]|nr:hypothetical protein ONZ45_g7810 [Pleurotus djamor]